MTAVLIDLRVRPVWSSEDQADCELVAVQARSKGLDGVVVMGQNRPVAINELAELTEATGVRFFAGVEVATAEGPLLCFPRATDAWFDSLGWLSGVANNGSEALPAAEAVVASFVERGGAVIAVPGGEGWRPPAGVCGLVVLGGDGAQLNDSAMKLAHGSRLACVAGTNASPQDSWFGTAATVFATPPADQEGLIDGLKSGRAWPAEIGWTQPLQVAAPRAAATTEETGAGPAEEPKAATEPAPERKTRERTREKPAKDPAAAEQPQGRQRTKKAPGRYDAPERPGDNRGNRLNRDELYKAMCLPATGDDTQPSNDPIALFYGVETRRQNRYRDRADGELDRLLNGNRAKGPDPNVMANPNFEEARGDRQPIQILFAQSEEQHDLEDSIALRFALSHVRRGEDGSLSLQGNPLDRGRVANRGRTQRRRR